MNVNALSAIVISASVTSVHAQAPVDAEMPAFNRVWSGDDYSRAAELLSSGKVPLPKLADPEGRAFLERETSVENLGPIRDKSLPIDARMNNLMKILEGGNPIFKRYMAAGLKDMKLRGEMVMQMSFLLRLGVTMVEASEEFRPTIPRDEKFAVRQGGLRQMEFGVIEVFAGAEMWLGEKGLSFSEDDISRLLQVMTETLPTIKRVFPARYAAELRKRLEKRKAEFSGKEDLENLQKMIAELGA